MGLPQINIVFKDKGASAVARSERGVVAVVLADNVELSKNPLTLSSVDDIPSTLNEKNKEYLEMAFNGYSGATRKVILSLIKTDTAATEEQILAACKPLKTTDANYLAVPEVGKSQKAVAEFVEGARGSNKRSMLKAVLPFVANSEAVIDNEIDNAVTTDGKTYSAAEYCLRIAAAAATCPMTSSLTNYALTDLVSCTAYDDDEADAAVDDGKLVAIWDGEKYKIARGITSLTATTADKGENFQKIRIVDALDMIRHDIYVTCEDYYQGKMTNTYEHQILLCNAINNYFEELVKQEVITSGNVEINLEKKKAYLKEKGVDLSDKEDIYILKMSTGSKVFLKGSIETLDVMEDMEFEIEL